MNTGGGGANTMMCYWVSHPQDLLRRLWMAAQNHQGNRQEPVYLSCWFLCQGCPTQVFNSPALLGRICVREALEQAARGKIWGETGPGCPCAELVEAHVEVVAVTVAGLRGGAERWHKDLIWISPALLFPKHLGEWPAYSKHLINIWMNEWTVLQSSGEKASNDELRVLSALW